MSIKKRLDSESFMVLIKSELENTNLTKTNGKPFYGKLTLCFKNGAMTHAEKHEMIK